MFFSMETFNKNLSYFLVPLDIRTLTSLFYLFICFFFFNTLIVFIRIQDFFLHLYFIEFFFLCKL